MATAESPRARSQAPAGAGAERGRGGGGRRWAWGGLAVVLAAGLGLRLWGVRQGLPYAYNADEADHFVPHAIEMFRRRDARTRTTSRTRRASPTSCTSCSRSPTGAGTAPCTPTSTNPEGRLHARTSRRGRARHARAVAALPVGARLFDRAVGLLAAAIEAVAFLPVFYAHLALNDVPTLAPATLSLLGTAGVLRSGRLRDHALAGDRARPRLRDEVHGRDRAAAVSCGGRRLPARCAHRPAGEDTRRAGAARALRARLRSSWRTPTRCSTTRASTRELVHQSTLSAEAQGKLGAPRAGGLVYYLWSLTWGLGWVPALAALAGAVAIWRRSRRLGFVLVPAPLAYLVFMGTEGRYFGRWLMPILPLLCLLAAFAGVALVESVIVRRRAAPDEAPPPSGLRQGAAGEAPSRSGLRQGAAGEAPSRSGLRQGAAGEAPSRSGLRQGAAGEAPSRSGLRQGAAGEAPSRSGLRRGAFARAPAVILVVVVVAALTGQGLAYSVHSGLVLSRADTRTLTREWMVANIPVGARVVVEPVSPNDWARKAPGRAARLRLGAELPLVQVALALHASSTRRGASTSPDATKSAIEDYVRTLSPALIGLYEQRGYCWVVAASTESGRAFADPHGRAPGDRLLPGARPRRAPSSTSPRPTAAARGRSPSTSTGASTTTPGHTAVPGPQMTVYRLHGGRCSA